MFKARIKADSLKEFIGTVGSLVDEAKLNVNEDGIQIKAVDPSHVAMIETNLVKSAFVENIGNLTRAMPLLDTSGMPDPKVPSLELPASVSVVVGEIGQGLKASKSVSDHIALSTTKDSFRLVCEGDNQNSVDVSLGKDQLEKLDSTEDATSLFSLEYFALMVNSLPADRILHINLGSDLPVKIAADLAVDDMAGAQGNVKFLLAPRIDRD